jgi:hypothetical protein
MNYAFPEAIRALMNHAVALCQATETVGIKFRLFGSCAVRIKCGSNSRILDSALRYPKDIDAVVYRDDRNRLCRLLRERGWDEDIELTTQTDGLQLRFIYSREKTMLDVCVDSLRFAQTLPLQERLEVDCPTISAVDLLLSKLQIFNLTEADVIDTLALLNAVPPERGNSLAIDLDRIAQIVSTSWSWYHSVTLSLQRVREAAMGSPHYLVDNGQELALARLKTIENTIVTVKKSSRWRLRAILGESVPWFNQVEVPRG